MIKHIYPDIKVLSKADQLRLILSAVAKKRNLPPHMLKSEYRFQELVEARVEYAEKAIEVTNDYTLIASQIGRDRTTINHYLNNYQKCTNG